MIQKVSLNWCELSYAATVGAARFASSEKQRKEARERGEEGPVEYFESKLGVPRWINDMHGAGAEMAVAKYLNHYWYAGINVPKEVPDLAPDIEVRSTLWPHGDLRIRKHEFKDRPYVLVRGEMPNFELVGWIMGKDGMKEEYWGNPQKNGPGYCYMVPDEALRPLSEQDKTTRSLRDW